MQRIFPIGYSTCPNDTFLFDAMVHGHIDTKGYGFEPVLEDVETLNRWAAEARLPITKLSFAALGHLLPKYALLPSGAALGRGCGPLLVGRKAVPPESVRGKTVAVPGEKTTARMLLGLFLGSETEVVPMPFDEIMPRVADGSFDYGVIIHEGRFVYEEQGMSLVQDLGVWWEESTGFPIPLGGIAIRRDHLSHATAIGELIEASTRYAMTDPDASKPYVTRHAQELAPEVVESHIKLYVNEFTKNLGSLGIRAVEHLFDQARKADLLPDWEGGILAE